MMIANLRGSPSNTESFPGTHANPTGDASTRGPAGPFAGISGPSYTTLASDMGSPLKVQLALLAKNLTDEKVLSFGGDTPLAGSTFGAKSNYAFYLPGQTLALQATVRF